MPALTVAPLPAPAGSIVSVSGIGFANAKTRLTLDGVGATSNIFRPTRFGTFTVGITVAATVKSQTLVAEQYTGGKWTVVARLTPLLTFLPPAGADVTPPVITAQAVSPTTTTVTVTWTTNEPSSSQCDWGTTTGYTGGPTPLVSALVVNHSVTVTGLSTSTLYHFRVRSKDAAGNEVVGTDMSTTTLATNYVPSAYASMILARTGVLGAWLFGDDSGSTFLDRTSTANTGTWTGSPTLTTVSPLPGDAKTAVTLATSDVGTIPHIAAYNRGNGPFSVEFWTNVSSVPAMLTQMLADTPTMLMRFNEPSGTVANDSSVGGTLDGTTGAGVTVAAAALVSTDTSYDFLAAGTTSKVSVPSNSLLDTANGAFTVAVVAKCDTTGSERTLLNKGSTGGSAWRLYISGGGTLALETVGASPHTVCSGPTANDTARHMYAATYDGAGNGKVYQDGVDITNSTDPAWSFATSTDPLVVGADQSGAVRWDGKMAYAALYRSAISAARIAAWYTNIDVAGGVDNYLVSKSDFSAGGWAVRQASSLVGLTSFSGAVNIRQTAAVSGWHHYVLTRGTGANGNVYVDGVDVTTVVGAITFSDVANALLLSADGGLYGVVYYNRVVTAAEALQSASYTYTVAPPTSVVGYGFNVTGGDNSGNVVHVTNLLDGISPIPAGSFRAALGSNRKIVFDVSGTINIASDLDINGVTNLTIAGEVSPGAGITFTGRPLWFKSAASNIIVRQVRHRGGYEGGQGSGNFNHSYGCYGILYQNVSSSGWGDGGEGMTFWDSNHDITVMDCFIGAGSTATHDFPMDFGKFTYRATVYRNLMYRGTYRNPVFGWNELDTDTADPPDTVGEAVNNLIWDYGGHSGAGSAYGAVVYTRAWANIKSNYFYSAAFNASDRNINIATAGRVYANGNYSKDGGTFNSTETTAFAVNPPGAQITPVSAATAAAYILTHGGCRIGGLDAIDQAWVDQINSVGL